MYQIDPDPPETVRFFSESLLSKWGFHDGELLDWLTEHNPNYSPHATLVACVEKKLLPVLDQRIELQIIQTTHNPCLARTVDGVDVSDSWSDGVGNPHLPLTPEEIVLTGEEILEIATELRIQSLRSIEGSK